jgi:hypothetical protein
VVDGNTGSAVSKGDGTWRLSVKGVNVLWFADRPTPASDTQTASSLAAQWKALFPGRPPFGAVLAPNGPNGHHPTAVQISDPSWDAASKTFSVTPKPNKGETDADAAWLGKLTTSSEAANGRVVMFVDDSSFTQNFTMQANASFAFSPDTSASQCATPYAITATGAYMGGSDFAEFSGGTDVSDSGWCDFEVSEAIWDLTYNGYADGTFELDFSGGSYSASCSDESPCYIDPQTGYVTVGG